MTFLQKLKKLRAEEFEHLIYDILVVRGLRNARWRTPGRDGGRDIEGEFSVVDFSGDIRSEKWYVECKRYKKSVDWPTVYEKLAYADNHDAEYLLICTTASLSPQCKDEFTKHNRRGESPKLRAWEGAALETMLYDEPLLAVKYSLTMSVKEIELSVLPILKVLTKTVHQIYGETARPTRAAEFAAAASEIATARLTVNQVAPNAGAMKLDVQRDIYPWAEVPKAKLLRDSDPYAVRLLLSAVRFLTSSIKLQVDVEKKDGALKLKITPAPQSKSYAVREILNTTCLMADGEWKIDGGALFVLLRRAK